MVYDPAAELPTYFAITPARRNDIVAAPDLPLLAGATYVYDLAYYDFGWLRALDTAAEADTATGGVDRNARIFPLIKIILRDGVKTLPQKQIAARFKHTVA